MAARIIEPLPLPWECLPEEYFLIRIDGSRDLFAAERYAGSEKGSPWLAAGYPEFISDDDVIVVARLIPDREEDE